MPLREAIDELLQAGFGSQEIAEAEQARKAAADAVDAQNALRSAREDREALIERQREGEKLDPDAIAYSAKLLLEAQMKVEEQKKQQPPDDNSRESS